MIEAGSTDVAHLRWQRSGLHRPAVDRATATAAGLAAAFAQAAAKSGADLVLTLLRDQRTT